MIKDNNKHKQQQYDPMTELELTKLAEKIVAKMMRLKRDVRKLSRLTRNLRKDIDLLKSDLNDK